MRSSQIAITATGLTSRGASITAGQLLVPVVSFADVVVNRHRVPMTEFFADDWKDVPVFLRHPPDALHGRQLEAWQDRNTIGRIISAEVKGDKFVQLLAVDYPTQNEDAVEVVELLKDANVVEVSLGFYGYPTEGKGVYNGREYDDTITNLRPWHLAILPDEVGACSIADGCGTYYNAARLADRARHPSYSGVEESSWSTPTLVDYLEAFNSAQGDDKEDIPTDTPFDELTDGLREFIAGHSLLGQKSAEDFEDLTLLPVVNPASGRLNKQALEAAIEFASSDAGIEALGEARAESAVSEATALLIVFEADEETETTTLSKETWLKLQAKRIEKMALEQSLNEISSAVMEAVWQEFSNDRLGVWPMVLAVFEDRVRFEMDGKTFEASYSMDDDRKVVLAEPVEGELEFVPVAASATPVAPEQRGLADAIVERVKSLLKRAEDGPEGEESMKEKLLAFGLSAEYVDGLSECRQKAVLAQLEGNADEPANNEPAAPEPTPVTAAQDPAPAAQPDIAKAIADGVEKGVKAATEAIPQLVETTLAARDSKKEREGHEVKLRAAGYSDADIEAMDDKSVAVVASKLPEPNYEANAPYLQGAKKKDGEIEIEPARIPLQ